jgi:hypothetical protein
MTPHTRCSPLLLRLLVAVSALAVATAALVLSPLSPAHAAARVQISSELGGNQAAVSSPTTVSLSGSGFQSIQGGFGGVYVLFGWVSSGDSWKPSNGGMTGTDYRYVPDSETKDNQGYQRFVTFPGSSTAGAANGGELAADGTWSAQMVIPGPVFDSVDRNGAVQRVDCREVRCGIITVGAHGVKNPSNETFTPIEFVGGGAEAGAAAAAASQQGSSADGSQQAAPGASAEGGSGENVPVEGGGTPDNVEVDGSATAGDDADGGAVPESGDAAAVAGSNEATIGLLATEIEQGGVVSFTAQGFEPGEQVVATLGLGSAGAGPYQAGAYGEVAGTVPIAADTRPGKHVLTLSGAGSQQVARVTMTITEAEAAPIPGAIGDSELTWWTLAVLIGLAAGLLVLVVLLVSALTSLLRKRRAARSAQRAEEQALEAEEDALTPEPSRFPSAPAALSILFTLALAGGSVLFGPSPSAEADDPDDPAVDVTVDIPAAEQPGGPSISNSSLSWGLNEESGGGAYFGGCNFLVAGEVGDVGSSHVWTAAEGAEHYRTSDGAVSIVHPRTDGSITTPGWDTKCIGESGSAVTTQPGSSTYNTAVFTGGSGSVDVSANTASVRWDGAVTVVFYGGMTYWTFSDPVLTVKADGTGELTATGSGYGADMYDASKWVPLAERTITLATLSGVDVTESGIVTTPRYQGVPVEVEPNGPSSPQNRDLDGWGSFPQSFIDFQVDTGQAAYWYTSGGLADLKKPASPMVISWDANDPIDAELPVGSGGGGNASGGAVPVGGGTSPFGGGVQPVGGGVQPVGGTVLPGGSTMPFTPSVLAPGVTQPFSPGAAGAGGVVDPTADDVPGMTPTAASGELTVPQWIGQQLIPSAAEAAFGTPARAAATFTATAVLSLLLWQGLRRGWLSLPFLPSRKGS